MDFLENIYRLWSKGKKLAVVEKTKQPQTDFRYVIDDELTNTNDVPGVSKFIQENIISHGTVNVNKIIMPCKVQMGGCPKGATLTAVGLKRKIKNRNLYLLKKKLYWEKRYHVDMISWWRSHRKNKNI